jgi:hypothetical protein
LSVSIVLKSDPAWEERGPGVGRSKEIVPIGVEININMAAAVLFNCSQLKRAEAAFLASPRAEKVPSPFKK